MNLDKMPEILILNECQASDKDELFHKLANAAARFVPVREAEITADEIYYGLLARERESSTELGGGLIFPHARFEKLQTLSAILVAQDSPVLPPSPDTQPINLICMMLIPEGKPMAALNFISRFAGCVRSPECRDHLCTLLRQGNLEKFGKMLSLDTWKSLSAADLMRPWRCELSPEQQLRDATRIMMSGNAPTIPVLKDGKLVGQLTCTELFKLGIPDFFTRLKSVGFIRYFDPFENYFAVEAKSKVADVMLTDLPVFAPDATLIEIVFAMVVEKVPLLYVTDANRRLLGVIDQTVLLERIINL